MHVESSCAVNGYEIHIGTTKGPDCTRPLFKLDGMPEGAQSPDGQITGTYLHGLLNGDDFRAAWLGAQHVQSGSMGYQASVGETLNALASHIEAHLDLEALLDLAE